MNLIDILKNSSVPDIESIDNSGIDMHNLYSDSEIRGRMAENLAMQWLLKTGWKPFDLPISGKEYEWKENGSGIRVCKGDDLFEFDMLGKHSGKDYFVEVKALKLDGYINKVPRALEFARDITDSPNLLIFVPFRYNSLKKMRAVEDTYQDVSFIDTKYSEKKLIRAINRFYR